MNCRIIHKVICFGMEAFEAAHRSRGWNTLSLKPRNWMSEAPFLLTPNWQPRVVFDQWRPSISVITLISCKMLPTIVEQGPTTVKLT